MVISNIKSTKYIERRIDISAYLMFAPIFFASIGIKNTLSSSFDSAVLWFGISIILTGIVSKIVGCGLGAKLSGFSLRDSLFIGIGMMPRAEVMLIVVQKGIDKHFIDTAFLPYALALVLISSIITPILLKIINEKSQTKILLDKLK